MTEQFPNSVETEFNKLLDRIKALRNLPRDIAENFGLKENLFSIFVAVYSKTPLFICGKPGSSKSISMQIIRKTFDGGTQRNAPSFMDGLRPLQLVYYQGSSQSTSEGIRNIFERAKDYQQQGNKQSVVFIDEIGLAEVSPNNPLKAMHKYLDSTAHSSLDADFNGRQPRASVAVANGKSSRAD